MNCMFLVDSRLLNMRRKDVKMLQIKNIETRGTMPPITEIFVNLLNVGTV